jgi:hypothetical protein
MAAPGDAVESGAAAVAVPLLPDERFAGVPVLSPRPWPEGFPAGIAGAFQHPLPQVRAHTADELAALVRDSAPGLVTTQTGPKLRLLLGPPDPGLLIRKAAADALGALCHDPVPETAAVAREAADGLVAPPRRDPRGRVPALLARAGAGTSLLAGAVLTATAFGAGQVPDLPPRSTHWITTPLLAALVALAAGVAGLASVRGGRPVRGPLAGAAAGALLGLAGSVGAAWVAAWGHHRGVTVGSRAGSGFVALTLAAGALLALACLASLAAAARSGDGLRLTLSIPTEPFHPEYMITVWALLASVLLVRADAHGTRPVTVAGAWFPLVTLVTAWFALTVRPRAVGVALGCGWAVGAAALALQAFTVGGHGTGTALVLLTAALTAASAAVLAMALTQWRKARTHVDL